MTGTSSDERLLKAFRRVTHPLARSILLKELTRRGVKIASYLRLRGGAGNNDLNIRTLVGVDSGTLQMLRSQTSHPKQLRMIDKVLRLRSVRTGLEKIPNKTLLTMKQTTSRNKRGPLRIELERRGLDHFFINEAENDEENENSNAENEDEDNEDNEENEEEDDENENEEEDNENENEEEDEENNEDENTGLSDFPYYVLLRLKQQTTNADRIETIDKEIQRRKRLGISLENEEDEDENEEEEEENENEEEENTGLSEFPYYVLLRLKQQTTNADRMETIDKEIQRRKRLGLPLEEEKQNEENEENEENNENNGNEETGFENSSNDDLLEMKTFSNISASEKEMLIQELTKRGLDASFPSSSVETGFENSSNDDLLEMKTFSNISASEKEMLIQELSRRGLDASFPSSSVETGLENYNSDELLELLNTLDNTDEQKEIVLRELKHRGISPPSNETGLEELGMEDLLEIKNQPANTPEENQLILQEINQRNAVVAPINEPIPVPIQNMKNAQQAVSSLAESIKNEQNKQASLVENKIIENISPPEQKKEEEEENEEEEDEEDEEEENEEENEEEDDEGDNKEEEGLSMYSDEVIVKLYKSTMDKIQHSILYQELKTRDLITVDGKIKLSKNTGEFQGMIPSELLAAWKTTLDMKKRDQLVAELQRQNLFPSNELSEWERETGAYPDIVDPMFLQKLLAKREFAESLQKTWKPQSDPCEEQGEFEVTPVQRFVANFMSPKTPYMSALLFHGVGVGKTCAAIQITEAWLEMYPQQEVFIIAPLTIQAGFLRTIFDITKVKLGEEHEPNQASQCTGTTYMKLSNTLYERDKERVVRQVNRQIRRRYKIMGYIAFANYIRDQVLTGIPPSASDEVKERMKKDKIRHHFSNRLVIVDEAHNLRDVTDVTDEDEQSFTGGKSEKDDATAGKKLTGYLLDVLRYAEGMKFCALTATPMYNTYKEIVFMFNLLLINDKKAPITEADLFLKDGTITPQGEERIGWIAKRYVSFMRGENPISFPIRLFPQDIEALTDYPELNPRGKPVVEDEEEVTFFEHLPLVPIPLRGDTLDATVSFMEALKEDGKGLSTMDLDRIVHAGNIVVPETALTRGDTFEAYVRRTNLESIGTVLQREMASGEVQYRAREEVSANWLALGNLKQYSPKFEFFLRRVQNTEGCVFAYTRFIGGGALPLALALEANGYTPHPGIRKTGMLADGIQSPGGRQCALCPLREKNHGNANHGFAPAYYGILTGDVAISPKNEQTIRFQRASDNARGEKMKVIIGSQLASEGVDLRFVRETHVIDSWYHLNKTEQILGRAIRFMSHCLLPREKRNNTVYLYAAVLPEDEVEPRETADLFSYRMGFNKAVLVGNVTRIMKQNAVDCNLNKDAIVIANQPTVRQIDSQGVAREEVNINDMPFTAVCDWIETCDYKCKPDLSVKDMELDDSTYDEYSARWRYQMVKTRVQRLFARQAFYRSDDFWHAFSDIPRMVLVNVLEEIVNNRAFQVIHGDKSGYIRYCNGYYLFQPNIYLDISIPLAIRTARFPIKRDTYLPVEYEAPEIKVEEDTEQKQELLRSVEGFWRAIMEWTTQLSEDPVYHAPPYEVDQYRRLVAQEEQEKLVQMDHIFQMIRLFHTMYHSSGNDLNNEFRRTLLFYFWDEWLTVEDQMYLVYSTDLNVAECVEESKYNLDRVVIHRFLDPKTETIQFMCEGGTACAVSFIMEIHRDRSDPVHPFPITNQHLGMVYGYNVSKNGKIIFKVNDPPYPGGKIGRGRECSIVSSIESPIQSLSMLSNQFEEEGYESFGIIQAMAGIKNSVRICTLLDLFLRLSEEMNLQERHWFLRPVRSFYTGHGTKSAEFVKKHKK